jgi:hypothetical protein
MGRKITRRTVVIDGHEMVAVRPADFERLDASRRQVGARMARVVRIQQQLQDAQGRLNRIRDIVDQADPAECVCERVAAALEISQNGGSAPIRSRRRS